MTEEKPETPTARRQRAHDDLDEYLDDLLAGEEAALASDNPYEARRLFGAGLVFLQMLIGFDVLESLAPKIISDSPQEMRKALINILYLLWPIWPGASRTTQGPFSESIWPKDLILALERFDGGETMPIFEAPKRPGKQSWTERRFHFLAVLWANHLEHCEGYNAAEANNLVARAFNPAISKDTPAAVRAYNETAGKVIIKTGGLPQGSVERWRRHFNKVAEGTTFDDAISAEDAAGGIRLASTPEPKPAAGVTPLNIEDISIFLYFSAFNEFAGAPDSLAEAGKLYQEFKTLK